MNLLFVGKRYLFQGKYVKVVGETDTGNIKLEDGRWTTYTELTPIDGLTTGFRIFDLPETNLALAA